MKGYIKAYEFIDGLSYWLFNMKKQDTVELPNLKAYSTKVAINSKKLDNISKVVHYIPD